MVDLITVCHADTIISFQEFPRMGCISCLLVFIQDDLLVMIQMPGTVYPHPAFGTGFPSIMVYKHWCLICLDHMVRIQSFMETVIKNG